MEMRRTGTLLAAIVSGLCLAAALGCGGKTTYNVPEVRTFDPPQAKVGASIVITGSYFDGVSAVSFGGEPAPSYQVNGSGRIVATLPANARTGDIVVQNPAGVGSSSFYNQRPFIVTPVVDSIDPVSGPAGTVVPLTGSGFSGAFGVAIGTDGTGSSKVTGNDPNHATVVVGGSATTGPVVLTVVDAVSSLTPIYTVSDPGPVFTVIP